MQDKKGQTQKLIMARVAEGPEKNQLSANMDLTKPRAKIDSINLEPDERIDIYANSDMKQLMSMGLKDDEFFEILEKMQAILETFASHKSGWFLQHVIQFWMTCCKMLDYNFFTKIFFCRQKVFFYAKNYVFIFCGQKLFLGGYFFYLFFGR